MQVDHELRQGAVQARNRAVQNGKAGAGQLGCGLKVQTSADFTQRYMIFDLEIEHSRSAPAAHLYVVILIGANRYAGVR
ncbi:hypothetical protein D3C73_1373730 [compost metagenome]